MFPSLQAKGSLTKGASRSVTPPLPPCPPAERSSQCFLSHFVTKTLCPEAAVCLVVFAGYLQALNKVGAVGGGTCSGGRARGSRPPSLLPCAPLFSGQIPSKRRPWNRSQRRHQTHRPLGPSCLLVLLCLPSSEESMSRVSSGRAQCVCTRLLRLIKKEQRVK